MNLQQLRQFVALAEELHFRRAAERLNMAQPPLSQSLARLEAELGFRLLDRTRRSVTLTPAGDAFLRDVRPALIQLDRATRMARKADAGDAEPITIGFVSSALVDIVPRAIKALARPMPKSGVRLMEMSTEQQRDHLLDGRIDIGFVYDDLRQAPDIQTCVVARYGTLAAIPVGWPLATRDTLSITDLKDMPFILFPYEQRPDLREILDAACRRHGFVLQVTHEIARSQTTISLVGAGIGMSLANDAVAAQGYPGVVFRPVEGLPAGLILELRLAWRITDATLRNQRAVAALLEILAID